MKRFTFLATASLILALGSSMARAQNTVYFDVNDQAPGSGVEGNNYQWNLDGLGLAPAFWNLDPDGVGAVTPLPSWVNGDHAVFAAGTDATGVLYGLQITAGVTAASAVIKEGTVQISTGLFDTGTGEVRVNTGAALQVTGSHLAGYGLNPAGKMVLAGGSMIQTNPTSAGSFLPAAKTLEIDGSGIIQYNGVGLVSIYTAAAAAGITGTGGTPTNGGSGTLIKRGTGEIRYQGPGLPNTSYAKLLVEQGLFRLGFSTVDVEERGFGAVPLSPLADAITLDGGFIAHSFSPTTLHVNRGITVTSNGGGWAGGTLTVPGSLTGSSTSLSITGGVLLLTNAGNASTFTNSKFVATAGTIGGNSDAAFGAVPASPVADYFTLGNGAAGNGTVRVDTTMTLNSNRGMTLVPGTTGGGQLTTSTSAVTVTYNGIITGGGNLTKTGLGTWVLGGNNDYTGITTTFGGGVLSISSESNIGTTPGSPVADSISLAGATTGGTLRATSSISLSPNRGVFINPGQATAADPATAVGGTLDVTSGNTLTVPGVISGAAAVGTTGAGRLTKSGAGTLVVTNDNTYTGTTTISGGTLLVNNTTGSGTGSNTVIVGASGVLGGTGNIGGGIANSGVIAPGSGGIGTLSVTGDVVNGATGIWHIELSGATTDRLAVTGNIDLTAVGDALNVTGTGSGSSWIIGTYTGSLTGVFDTITSGYTVNYTGGNITLNAAAGLPGDFNTDGKVDAGDYITWRKSGTNPLPNDNGAVDAAARYTVWRQNFGNPPGAGSGSGLESGGTVPEPTSLGLVLIGLGFFAAAGRRRTR